MNRKLMRLLTFMLVIALVLPLMVPASYALAGYEKPGDKFKKPKISLWLTLLHNNDGESDLINLGTGLEDFGGVARFKTLVDREKFHAVTGHMPLKIPAKRGVVMLSSGDNFLAGPEWNASLEKGVPYYDTIAMDLIGYDAVAFGNHDFDFGPDVTANFIAGYSINPPPYLSANLIVANEPLLKALEDENRIAASTVRRFGRNMVGIIGATTPALPFITSPRNVEVLDDVVGAVQAEVDYLESRGVKIIVLISHLQSIEEDIAMAPMLDGVDIIIAGGGDELLANEDTPLIPGDESIVYGTYPMWTTDMDGTDVPVVTTRGSYAYLGKLVAGFDKYGELILIDEKHSFPIRVAGGDNPDAVMPDPEVQAMVVDPVVEYVDNLASNIVATSEVALDATRPNIRIVETNEGNLIADSLLWQATQVAADFGVAVPDIALQNGGGIRNNSIIPAGPISELDTFSMVPFSNYVSVVEAVSREQFKEIMENAVSRVEFVDGRFAQIAGFTFVWDPAGTPQILDLDGNVTQAGSRVVNVTLDDGTVIIDGGVVQAGDPLTIATIDFLANGGDQYPYRGMEFTRVGFTYQQALSNYLQDGLGGVITAADYPEGGEGRITELP